jgi:hypothetical protein
MAVCTDCGAEMEYVNQHSKWFCRSCNKYQQPVQQRPAQQQMPPPSNRSMKGVLAAVIIVVIVIVLAAVLFLALSDEESKGETATMDMLELVYNEYDIYENGFRTLGDGDTLIIEDTIIGIYHDDWDGTTEIYFVGGSLYFQGDLTSRYSVYDKVVITLHIIEINYAGYTWEYFEEGWSGNRVVPFPATCIDFA